MKSVNQTTSNPEISSVPLFPLLIVTDDSVHVALLLLAGPALQQIRAGPQPGQPLLKGDPLWNGERPVDGVQLGVPIDTTVVPDVCARKRTRVSGDVPLTFFLEKLELGRPLSPHGGRSQAALSGRNAAIRLYLGGVEAIVRREVIAVFHSAVAVLEREAVGIGGRAEGCETKEGDHHE